MSTKALVPRLGEAAQVLFQAVTRTPGSQAILFGGGAAVLLGQNRNTRDLDVNVTVFPDTRNMANLYDRPGKNPEDKEMRKITYFCGDGSKSDIKCDISTRRAADIPRLLKYTIKSEEFDGVVIADHRLLLADKIHTYAERNERNNEKAETDIQDIRWCIESLFDKQLEMDVELRTLYTAEEWMMVRAAIEDQDVIDMAEQFIKIKHD